MKKIFLIIIAVTAAALICPAARAEVILKSPSGNLTAKVSTDSTARLIYALEKSGDEIILNSPLGITIDGNDMGLGVEIGKPERGSANVSYEYGPGRMKAVDRHNSMKLPVRNKKSGAKFTLEMRMYDDGLAYRYAVDETGMHLISGEASGWNLPGDATLWYQNNLLNYEGLYTKAQVKAVRPGERFGVPITVRLPGGAGYMLVTEGALFDYSGMSLVKAEGGLLRAEFLDDRGGWVMQGKFTTPWRIAIVAFDLNGVFNSRVIVNVNEPPSPVLFKDTSWIKPGQCLGPWLNGGWSAMSPDNIRVYIDAAKELGVPYVLIDDGWDENPPFVRGGPFWSAPGRSTYDILQDIVVYAKERGVKMFVWKYYFYLTDPDYREKYFAMLEKMGVAGIEIDFMDSESQFMIRFYEACLSDGAKHRLMVLFHGANKPTGELRRYPNEVAREAVRGLEYKNTMADHYATVPFTRLLAGHLDFTPMEFNKVWMSNTSWTLQIASLIIFASEVAFPGADPKDILSSPARDIISQMPTVWDQTIVLPQSEIGALAAFARRKGDLWYVAMMNGGAPRKIKLPLDFLGDGGYSAVLISDAQDRSDALSREETTLNKSSLLTVKMRGGGGFVAVIKK
jgi:hypothetical protein